MKLGFQFHREGQQVTLWTVIPDKPGGRVMGTEHGGLSQVSLSYSDSEITECRLTFQNPSENFVRQMLSIIIAEATALDQVLDFMTGTLWVQDTRVGYEPVPLFSGVILNLSCQDGPPDTCTVILHDFWRLANAGRDIQDYQNLVDADIAGMLGQRLSALTGDDGQAAVTQVIIDREAVQSRTAAASAAPVRRFSARLFSATAYEKVVKVCAALGFRVTSYPHPTKKMPDGRPVTMLSITPWQGNIERPAGTYRRGDGEVISFQRQYDPPGQVMQRNIMSRKFDPVMEVLMAENALNCTTMDKDGNLRDAAGELLSPLRIESAAVLRDPNTNKPLDKESYKEWVRKTFQTNTTALGWNSKKGLMAYQDRIAFRAGVHAPSGGAGNPAVQAQQQYTDSPLIIDENLSQGNLYWRFTGKLTVQFNPLLTTTDYLDLKGWGVWDGVWGIRSITHNISETPQSTFDLTFGPPARI
ncbi:hypothetical protein [Deinococcus kurensis]|uniref:hypothetical protein n=1 Tax=Deinococcus kurensis TaxID=2662757 RepID=UPI0012D2E244|nr:hypothetical protein [Deinococcus kurensis]